MLWNKDVGKNKISLIIDILIFWFYGYIEYIRDNADEYFGKKILVWLKVIKIHKNIRKIL